MLLYSPATPVLCHCNITGSFHPSNAVVPSELLVASALTVITLVKR